MKKLTPAEHEQMARGMVGMLERLRELEASLKYVKTVQLMNGDPEKVRLLTYAENFIREQIQVGWQLEFKTLESLADHADLVAAEEEAARQEAEEQAEEKADDGGEG